MAARALDAEAPYFVDYIGQELQDKYQRRNRRDRRLHHLDLHMQRLAQDAVREAGWPASTSCSRNGGSGTRRPR